VSASHFVSGDVFDERVLGVALGESQSDCVSRWGKPIRIRKNSGIEYRTEWFHHAGYIIEIEVWKRDGHEDGFGDVRAETLKAVAISRQEIKRTR
jgi:hypothetical protein